MPDFVIIPAADHTADPTDRSNAIYAYGASSPTTITGLTNGTAYVARELLESPASDVFTPEAAVSANVTAQYIGSFEENVLNATAGSGTFDLSSANAGDKLVIMYGTASVVEPSFTVDGNAVPASIVDTSDGAFGGKNFVFEYTLTGTEGASTPVAFSNADAGNRHFVALVLVKDGTRDDAGINFQGQIEPVEISVTPASSENVVVAIVMGRTSFLGAGRSWANVTEDTLEANTPNDRAFAVAFASDVAAAPLAVSFTPDPGANASDEVSLAVLVYSA